MPTDLRHRDPRRPAGPRPVPQRRDRRAGQAQRRGLRRAVRGPGLHRGRAVARPSSTPDPAALQGPDQLPDARPARLPVRAQLDDVLRQAPIFVFREFMRHRVGCPTTRSPAATASSSRCSTSRARSASWCSRASPGSTSSSTAPPSSTSCRRRPMRGVRARRPTRAYQRMLDAGVAREVARMRAAGRDLLVDVRRPERPLADELPVAADQARGLALPVLPAAGDRDGRRADGGGVGRLMPLTHAAFEANGRVAP